MLYNMDRRAAVTTVSLILLVSASGGQAQTRQSPDCRYEPNVAVAAPNWVDQNGCLRTRRSVGEVGVTGAIGRAGTVTTRSPVGRGNSPLSGAGRIDAGGVSAATKGPIGSVDSAASKRTNASDPRGNGSAGNVTNPTDQGGAPKVTDPTGHGGNVSAKNNNGLGNGYDPGDAGFVAGDPNTDLNKGVDPSNPGRGAGAPGRGGGKGGKS